MPSPQTIVGFAGIYALIGLLFGVAFITFGLGQVDPATRGSGVLFRLMILPGCAALWPVMARRWLESVRRGGAS